MKFINKSLQTHFVKTYNCLHVSPVVHRIAFIPPPRPPPPSTSRVFQWKIVVGPAFGWEHRPKAGWNTQHICHCHLMKCRCYQPGFGYLNSMKSFLILSDQNCSPEGDSKLGPSRFVVFENCKAIGLTTQPTQLDLNLPCF